MSKYIFNIVATITSIIFCAVLGTLITLDYIDIGRKGLLIVLALIVLYEIVVLIMLHNYINIKAYEEGAKDAADDIKSALFTNKTEIDTSRYSKLADEYELKTGKGKVDGDYLTDLNEKGIEAKFGKDDSKIGDYKSNDLMNDKL